MDKNRKGVSPLIATVLIIGFTIVLAAVVMQWGGSFVRDLTEKTAESTTVATECIAMNFDITKATYIATEDKVEFQVTSNIDKEVSGFIAMVEGIDRVQTWNLPIDGSCIIPGYSTKTCKALTPDVTIKSTDKLKLIPMIKLKDGSLKGCTADSAKSFTITLA